MKQYKIGMYGGKFLPFHKGHRFCVETAALECETVYVILFWGGADEEIILREHPEIWLSVEERTRQMNKICEDAAKYAKVIPSLIDITGLRLPDGSEDWEAETPLVRNLLGNQLDAVYSSEESYVVSVGMYIAHFDAVYLTKRSIYLIMAVIGLINWAKLNRDRNIENE